MKEKLEQQPIESDLRRELFVVAKRLRELEFLEKGSRRWLVVAAISMAMIGWRYLAGSYADIAFYFAGVSILAVCILNLKDRRRKPLDYRKAAILIEADRPSLKQALLTAVEQLDSEQPLGFLQRRVIKNALQHPSRLFWEDSGRKTIRNARLVNAGMISLIGFLLGLAYITQPVKTSPITQVVFSDKITILPGDSEIERGSTVVITARFSGETPASATLVTQGQDGAKRRIDMARSLSDPVFAYALQDVQQDTIYEVEFEDRKTEDFSLTVYDLPALVQADALLDYPAYTGWKDRKVEDTRRISAVEGTHLEYSFQFNKPISQALLVDLYGDSIALEAANPERTRFTTSLVLKDSLRWSLKLKDDAERSNADPPDIRIDALPNKRPELAINFPKGDQRVSPIEEIDFQGEARDDFGLLDYGVGFSIGSQEPDYVSLKSGDNETMESAFRQTLELEEKKLEPNDLVSWFVWAEDFNPKGEPRRTSSDLYFAEVRSLDEIFREQQGGQGQQGQGGGAGEELLDQQRQIAIAIWKLKQRGIEDSSFLEDSEALMNSQSEVLNQLSGIKSQLQEDEAKKAAAKAEAFMETTVENLDTVVSKASESELDPASRSAQGAYRALLSMMPKEFNVGRNQGGGGGGGGNNRNQGQLNQMEFQQEDDRYETESQAQASPSPEDREQLEILSKLNELSRRQQDINERLQELQTALAAAENEEEREKIRRELKRLEEEQRDMLTDVDETRQRMDRLQSNEETRNARSQLDDTREQMQKTSEQLEQGEISQALASGSRANENLENLKEDFRQNTSSQFAEQLRNARKNIRDLTERQKEIESDLDQLNESGAPRLDDSEDREGIARKLDQQKESLEALLQELKQVTEDSEASEPRLHRQLYDMLRDQSQEDTDEKLDISSQMMRQGFVNEARQLQPELQENLDTLRRQVEQAAESILGDETTTLRFAQSELDELSNQLEGEKESTSQAEGESSNLAQSSPIRNENQTTGQQQASNQAGSPGDSQSGGSPSSPSQSQSSNSEGSEQQGQALAQGNSGSQAGGSQGGRGSANTGGSRSGGFGGGGGGIEDFLRTFTAGEETGPVGPITGDDFIQWSERLRTVQDLMEQGEARDRIADARANAENMRREFKRHGTEPQWGLIEEGIVAPLNEVRSWVRQELSRRESSDTLQPVDRDPVPQEYAESVRKYYEALAE